MKNQLRKEYIEIRKNIKNKQEKSEKIMNSLLCSDFYKKSTSIFVYVSTEYEVNSRILIEKMLADGKTLSAPKCIEKGIMKACKFSSLSELVPDKFGILAPTGEEVDKIDLIIVPGVAFSEDLHRLGYGGGYYDRFLENSDAVSCGLFFEEQKGIFPTDTHDIPLDFIITEEKIYEKR